MDERNNPEPANAPGVPPPDGSAVAGGVGELLDLVPGVARSAGWRDEDFDRIAGWKALRARHASREAGAIVWVLYGPTGSGKSAFFRALTGTDVPSGGALRPMTFVGCAAIPEALLAGAPPDRLFPGLELQELQSGEQLKEKGAPRDRLFWTTTNSPDHADRQPVVIVDVPDFDSVEVENAERAAQLLARAEATLFLVYNEAYSSNGAVTELARCCRESGFLAVVLTKCTAEEGAKKRAHLLERVAQDPRFDGRRTDGQPLVEFLAAVPFYASAPVERPSDLRLEELVPLTEGAPPLAPLLHGLERDKILQAALHQPAVQLARESLSLVAAARERQVELRGRIALAEREIERRSKAIAERLFPMQEFIHISQRALMQEQPAWSRHLSRPVHFVRRQVRKASDSYRSWREEFRGAVDPKAEKDATRNAAESVADSIRNDLRSRDTGDGDLQRLLSVSRVRECLDRLSRSDMPRTDEDWKARVREETLGWAEEYKVTRKVAPRLFQTVWAGGGTVFMVDIFLFGGFGTLATAGVTGAGAALAAIFGNALTEYQASQHFKKASEVWQQKRSVQLAELIRTAAIGPLCLDEWEGELRRTDREAIAACEAAARRIIRNLPQEARHDG